MRRAASAAAVPQDRVRRVAVRDGRSGVASPADRNCTCDWRLRLGDAATFYSRRMPSDTKPNVTIPDGPPPTELVLEELEVGTGEVAVSGKPVTVHYVGVSWSTGGEFDSSWNRDELFSFPLGAGHVIQGWDEGVAGMQVGGRRRITIPPELGYGSRGAGGVIGPNETLVFVVDLFDVG